MIITLIITLIILILIFRFLLKLLGNIFSFFENKSSERKTRILENTAQHFAGKLGEAERKIEFLQKNSVPLAKYQKLERECDLLTTFIKQHIEKNF